MLASTADATRDTYAGGCGLQAYLGRLRRKHPDLYDLLSPERYEDAEQHIAELNAASWEFEDERAGGRGTAYISAQRSLGNRRTGMITLLNCFWPCFETSGRSRRVLDVLGGDGTIAGLCETLGPAVPTIYTADISQFMISACDARGYPAIRQSATRSLFRDSTLDGVLIAYGSHHLDGEARPKAVGEAYRTLKDGGRLVLHDFEVGGKCAAWFEKVVDPYSRTGHPHPHFSRDEMSSLFEEAGFRDVQVFEIGDPFTLTGSSPVEARDNAVRHMHAMYDLVKVADSPRDIVSRLEPWIEATLGPIAIRREGGQYVAEIARKALVAVGTKPRGANGSH